MNSCPLFVTVFEPLDDSAGIGAFAGLAVRTNSNSLSEILYPAFTVLRPPIVTVAGSTSTVFVILTIGTVASV